MWYHQFSDILEGKKIADRIARANRELLEIDFWNGYRELQKRFVLPRHCNVRLGDEVAIDSLELQSDQRTILNEMIRMLLPWRKGPFNLLGEQIDSEWRSFMKWDRLREALSRCKMGRVADVGCNNGYYMFRMLELNPELVVGLDPNARFFLQFNLVNSFVRSEKLFYELLGVEDLDLFEGFFDVILCLGVLYHRKDPIGMLEGLKRALTPKGGTLVLESITLPEEFGIVVPKDRYSMMRNIWFLTSPTALCNMVERAGFRDVEIVDTSITTPLEQRKTGLAPFDSLTDFLDPSDQSKTVEGYPAPRRTILLARS